MHQKAPKSRGMWELLVDLNGFIYTWYTSAIVTKSQDIILRTFIFHEENQLKM